MTPLHSLQCTVVWNRRAIWSKRYDAETSEEGRGWVAGAPSQHGVLMKSERNSKPLETPFYYFFLLSPGKFLKASNINCNTDNFVVTFSATNIKRLNGLFPHGYHLVSDKTWCSIAAPNVLSSWAKRKCDEHVLHHFPIWQRQTHPAVLRGGEAKLSPSQAVEAYRVVRC
jgi:hypothetical protein